MQWDQHAVHLPGGWLQRDPVPDLFRVAFRVAFNESFGVALGVALRVAEPAAVTFSDPFAYAPGITASGVTPTAPGIAGAEPLGAEHERKPVPGQRRAATAWYLDARLRHPHAAAQLRDRGRQSSTARASA
jgi:hypothetical protein